MTREKVKQNLREKIKDLTNPMQSPLRYYIKPQILASSKEIQIFSYGDKENLRFSEIVSYLDFDYDKEDKGVINKLEELSILDSNLDYEKNLLFGGTAKTEKNLKELTDGLLSQIPLHIDISQDYCDLYSILKAVNTNTHHSTIIASKDFILNKILHTKESEGITINMVDSKKFNKHNSILIKSLFYGNMEIIYCPALDLPEGTKKANTLCAVALDFDDIVRFEQDAKIGNYKYGYSITQYACAIMKNPDKHLRINYE